MDFDTTEIRNPKRTLARRMQEAEDGTTATPAAQPASGAMSQSQFSGYGKNMTPAQKKASQEKLAQMLRNQG